MEFVKKVALGVCLLNFVYGVISLIQLNHFLPLLPLEAFFIAIMALSTWFYAPKNNKIKHVLLLYSLILFLSSPLLYTSLLTYDQVVNYEELWLDYIQLIGYLSLGVLLGNFIWGTFRRLTILLPVILFFIASIYFNTLISPLLLMSVLIGLLFLIFSIFNFKTIVFNHYLGFFLIGTAVLVSMNQLSFLLG
jgi:hypothetical protein